MRVNVYAEEITDRVELISKTTKDGTFIGLRFYLELPVTQPSQFSGHEPAQISGPFKHHADDDDSAAVTFWGKRELISALEKALVLLHQYYGPQQAAPVSEQARRIRRDASGNLSIDEPEPMPLEAQGGKHHITDGE